MEKNILKTKDITKKYSNAIILDNINMTIEKGDIYGLIGKNGAGKTTLIRIITGLIDSSKGSIELFNSTNLKLGRKRIGAIVEYPALYMSLTAQQNLEYYRIERGIVEKNKINECLDLVGLTDTGKKKVKNFSLGMKQRLSLAIAILGNPDFIILDEPINGLDPIGIIEIRNIIKRLNEELGITILISSHILTELSHIATKYGIVNDGKLIKQLTKEELENECKKSLLIKVDDVSRALTVIERELKTTNYIVINDKELRLFEYLDDSDKVVKILINNKVSVRSITETTADLEEYFREVIGEDK